MKLLLAIFTILSCVSCGDKKNEATTDRHPAISEHASEENKIDEVYTTMSLAYKTYDIKLIEKIYTDEAYTIYAGDTNSISHEKNIFASFQRTFDYHKQREITLDMKFKIIERKIDKEMAYDIGYFRIDKTDKQGVKTKGKPGKFVTVLIKQADSSWKFQVDIYGDASYTA